MINFIQAAAFSHNSPSLQGVTAGHTLITAVLWAGNAGNLPVDNKSNTWKVALQPFGVQPIYNNFLNPYLQVFYSLNVAAGNTYVGLASDNGVLGSVILEYSGITTFVTAVANAGYQNGSDPITTPSINTKMGDFLFTIAMCNGTNLTTGTGYTQRTSLINPNVAAGDQSAIGGLYKAIFDAINVDNYVALMASFR